MMPKLQLKPEPNFDLLPENPRPLFIQCQNTKINVVIDVETKKPCSAKTDRWEKVAVAEMQRYRDIVEETVTKVTAGWEKAGTADDPKKLAALVLARKKSAADLTLAVNNACRSMKGAIEKAVGEQIKREAQGDANLREARVGAAIKGTVTVISIAKDVAELAVTAGANVKAWVSLCKDIVALAKLINDQCKDEPKLREELLKAIGTYSTTKQRRWNEAKKATDWKAKAKLLAKQIWTSEKSLAEKAEAQRKKYRNEVTALIQKVDGLGEKRDALLALLKKSGRVDAKGIAEGSKMTRLQKSAREMNSRILECQKFVDDMAFLLKESGVEVDDATFMQQLKGLKNLSQIKTAAKEIYDAATDLQTLIATIKG
jgi:hypothetical protein